MKYIINGKFMSDRMQGIVRYAREIVSALDRIIGGADADAAHVFDITLVIPPDACNVPQYKNIKVKTIGSHTGIRWEQTDLKKYIKVDPDAVCIGLCNVAPYGVRPGITLVHDIMYKVCPEYFRTARNRLSRAWHCMQYAYIAKHERAIITDSEYSRKDIEKSYPKAKGRIYVIPGAWQHVLLYKEAKDWRERYPQLSDGEYFFSLSTLAKNKNGGWIIEAAKKNKDLVFAIAGKYYETEVSDIPANVHMLGFVSDADACALIKHCRAFIHPSLYEGFGLPPLEALALGADVISSDATSLPEVLGDAVHYINPHDPDVDIEEILSQPVATRQEVLDKYSWEKSAERLLEVMRLWI